MTRVLAPQDHAADRVRRRRWSWLGLAAIVTLAAGASVVIRERQRFDIGETRHVTMTVRSECWTVGVTVDGWSASSSSGDAYSSWGNGPEPGTLRRIDAHQAEFVSDADGNSAVIYDGFHQTNCSLVSKDQSAGLE